VPVAHAADYEAEVKRLLAEMAATEEGKKLEFFGLSARGDFTFVVPLADMADFSTKSQEMMAAMGAIGGMEAWDEVNKLIDHGSGQLVALRPDISYKPAEPREVETTGRFRFHDWWYVRPGHEAAIEAVAKKIAALYEEKGIDTGWRVYQAITGGDLPLYLVSTTATDAADYHANDARVNGLLSDAMQELIGEALSHTRRVESTWSVMRPDLSMGM
jgi:hypothetical protein